MPNANVSTPYHLGFVKNKVQILMFLFLKSQHGNKQATTYHIGTEWWRNAFIKQILPDNGLEKVMVHHFIKSSVA
jgi:hypothetical protein